ncbi:MAG: peptidoglycan DD-metalloendopeptidase family protein [Eubacterium sp.]|nr:peptidoglycan DD-metalloendopeptidase family protein [Eubacterium sp.]
MFKTNTKKVLSAVLIGAMIFAVTPSMPKSIGTVKADELSEAREKKAEASQKKKEAQGKLKELKVAKDDTIKVIEQLDKEITGYQEKISILTDKRNTVQAEAAVTENSLQTAYIAEVNQYDSMKERIQFAYENGDAEYIDALLSIKDYSSVTNQAEYVDKVSVYDQKQLNELLEIEKDIAEYKGALEESLVQIEDLKTEAEGEKAALQVMQNGKQEALAEYNAEISDTEYDIAQLEKLEAEQDAQIAAIEKQAAARRAAAEQAAAAAAAAAASGSASATNATPVTVPPSYGGGQFTWPLPGYYSMGSGFGPRVAPTAGASTFHKGVDIGCPQGTPIVSAADGVVSYAGYFGGGGNAIIVDHGGGLSTVYMHMSAFAVGAGTNVSAGTVIGYAGSTGVSTGPHLHFAVRVNGAYVDPMGYL